MDKHNSRQVNKDLLKFEICTYLFIDYFQHTGVELILESSRNKKRSEKKKNRTPLHVSSLLFEQKWLWLFSVLVSHLLSKMSVKPYCNTKRHLSIALHLIWQILCYLLYKELSYSESLITLPESCHLCSLLSHHPVPDSMTSLMWSYTSLFYIHNPADFATAVRTNNHWVARTCEQSSVHWPWVSLSSLSNKTKLYVLSDLIRIYGDPLG